MVIIQNLDFRLKIGLASPPPPWEKSFNYVVDKVLVPDRNLTNLIKNEGNKFHQKVYHTLISHPL